MTATSRAFTHSVVKVTSRHSFILFRPSFYFNGSVWGQNLGPFGTKCDYNMPLGLILDAEKKNLLAPQPKKSASNFCDLFHFTLSLIFTRTVAIWPFFVVFCFSIHTVNSPNLPPPTPRGGGEWARSWSVLNPQPRTFKFWRSLVNLSSQSTPSISHTPTDLT